MATFTSTGWTAGSTVSAIAGVRKADGSPPDGSPANVQIASITGSVTFTLDPGHYVATDGARAVDILVEQPSVSSGGGGGGTPDDGSVDTLQLADGGVTTAKLADGAVTTVKLEDGAVTSAKVDATIATQAALDDVSNASVGTALAYVSQTANFTVAAADAGKMTEVDSAGAVTITIPTDAAGSMPTTGVWMFRREGAGSVNFVVSDSNTTTLHAAYDLAVIARQYDVVTLEKRAVDDYRLYGNLA